MYWDDDKKTADVKVKNDVMDLVFGLSCRCLPVDHIFALSQALQTVLPWVKDEPLAGLHGIYVAASGNGWIRPEGPSALLHLSRRTKLVLRVPVHRIDDAKQLQGALLNVDGHAMEIKAVKERPLSTITTLFTRAIATDQDMPEESAVLDWVAQQLAAMNIKPRKMLCGTEHFIESAEGSLRTRSLMIADLEVEESLILQQRGLGPYRHMGCGLFLPHRHINDLSAKND
ncbi:MAG: type I-MYXAN CRISPR-associated protein Cas6/Cmx6 [Ectothiorhodospiraceae bacterium]|nr:type I-MYXAN CRISPR-associated protein Cas6/Cmx6 [Ectothiorhodospiraceae bacterium]